MINSTNPLQAPLIDFRTMTDPIDFDLVVASTLMNRIIMSQATMKVLGPKEAAPFGNDKTGEDELRKILAGVAEPSSAHQCCTAAMMPKELGGVVDPDMKVYDVKGLRVIDTSYWPMVLTAAPTATTYASAEKVGVLRTYLAAAESRLERCFGYNADKHNTDCRCHQEGVLARKFWQHVSRNTRLDTLPT
jgi:choline dehydrogenase-like flavoprotein